MMTHRSLSNYQPTHKNLWARVLRCHAPFLSQPKKTSYHLTARICLSLSPPFTYDYEYFESSGFDFPALSSWSDWNPNPDLRILPQMITNSLVALPGKLQNRYGSIRAGTEWALTLPCGICKPPSVPQPVWRWTIQRGGPVEEAKAETTAWRWRRPGEIWERRDRGSFPNPRRGELQK